MMSHLDVDIMLYVHRGQSLPASWLSRQGGPSFVEKESLLYISIYMSLSISRRQAEKETVGSSLARLVVSEDGLLAGLGSREEREVTTRLGRRAGG